MASLLSMAVECLKGRHITKEDAKKANSGECLIVSPAVTQLFIHPGPHVDCDRHNVSYTIYCNSFGDTSRLGIRKRATRRGTGFLRAIFQNEPKHAVDSLRTIRATKKKWTWIPKSRD